MAALNIIKKQVIPIIAKSTQTFESCLTQSRGVWSTSKNFKEINPTSQCTIAEVSCVPTLKKCCDMFSHCLISCELTKFGHRSLHLFNQLIKHSCQSLPSQSSMGHPWDIHATLFIRLVPLSCSGGLHMGHWTHMDSPTCPTLQWDLNGRLGQWPVDSELGKNWNGRYYLLGNGS